MKPSHNLILIGGGEHARVVAEAARAQIEPWNVLGFVDDRPCPETVARLGLSQFASDDEALAHVSEACFVIAIGRIGSAGLRRNIVGRFVAAGARWGQVIHRAAWVSPTAEVQDGVVVLAGAVVNTGAVLGAHSIINTGAVVEHDVKLGSFVNVAPAAIIGGATEVEEECYLGLGCRVRDHIRIGLGTVVGMGAVVVHTLPGGIEAVGIPARARVKREYV